MDKIISLLAQWNESSPNPNKVYNNSVETPEKEESLEPEHVEVPKVDETLTENMESQEDEGTESKKLDHDSLVDDDEVQHPGEVIFPFSNNDVTSIFHTSQPTILVFSKFTHLYHVSMRAKNKRVRENK